MMKRFVFIIDYRRKVYLYFVTGRNLTNASRTWLLNWNYFTPEEKIIIKREVLNDSDSFSPGPLLDVNNIWFDVLYIHKAKVLRHVNIVEIAKPKSNNKLSFIAYYAGGTYISQYQANNINDGLIQWAKGLELEYFSQIEKDIILRECLKEDVALNNINQSMWEYKIKIATRKYLKLFIVVTA